MDGDDVDLSEKQEFMISIEKHFISYLLLYTKMKSIDRNQNQVTITLLLQIGFF